MNRALWRIHRLEYPFPIHYFCYAIWGACYASGNIARFASVPVLLVILANVLHPMSMSALNSAVDTRSDARNPHKRDLARAVAQVGVRRIVALALAEMTLCLSLCGVAALLLRRPLVAITMAAIVALHLSYNLEPIRLKRRGLVNPFAQGISFGLLPCVLSHAAVTMVFPAPVWLIYTGLSLSLTARSLWWMVPDRDADAAAGTPTSAVHHGAARMAELSCVLALAAPVLLGWGLWQAYNPGWALFGAVLAGAWFAGQLASLRSGSVRGYSDLRKRLMTPMMLANVGFAVIPLAAN